METVWRMILLYGDFMVKLIWRSSGDLIYHAFSMKIPDNLQAISSIKST